MKSKTSGAPDNPILRTCCVVVAYLGFFISGVPTSGKIKTVI